MCAANSFCFIILTVGSVLANDNVLSAVNGIVKPPMLIISSGTLANASITGGFVGTYETDCSPKDASGKRVVPSPTAGFVQLPLGIKTEGLYTIHARTHASDSMSDSFWVQFDNTTRRQWNHLHQFQVWGWDPIALVGEAPFTAAVDTCFWLRPENATIRIFVREPGAALDALAINPAPAPVVREAQCDEGTCADGDIVQIRSGGLCGPGAARLVSVAVAGIPCTNVSFDASFTVLRCRLGVGSCRHGSRGELVLKQAGDSATTYQLSCAPPRSLIVPIVASVLAFVLAVAMGAGAFRWYRQQIRFRLLYNTNRVTEDAAVAIASMKLEQLEYLRTIPKPSRIQQALIRIVDTLIEYRRYLPDALLHAASDDAAGDPAPQEGTIIARQQSHVSLSSTHETQSRYSIASSESTKTRDKEKRFSKSQIRGRKSTARAASISPAAALHCRLVVYLHCRIQFTMQNTPNEPTEISKAVDYVTSTLRQSRGVLHRFSGNSFQCHWNAVATVAESRIRAAEAALKIAQYTGTGNNVKILVGVSTGVAHVGHLGGNSSRAFCVVSPIVAIAQTLSHLAGNWDAPIIDFPTAESIHYSLPVQLLHAVTVNDQPPCLAFALLASANGGAKLDEWMYELQEMNNCVGLSQWNTTMLDVFNSGDQASLHHLLPEGVASHGHIDRLRLLWHSQPSRGNIPVMCFNDEACKEEWESFVPQPIRPVTCDVALLPDEIDDL
eukprot:TRINITY_DN68874_c0_g1_i1.p1 TRINITY_DN68874_c0_g1~~TRINITY_DN68874_c0_g1_i1.p1  ORF type:complete len:726 (-),score=74.24 TRINITY_DN68874_c0_g1_i1:25-2202(-)